MRSSFLQLLHNLRAGARLAFFLPVRRDAFHFEIADLLWLFLASAIVDFASDWVRYNPGAHLSLYGAGSEIFSIGLLLVSAAVLAVVFHQRVLALVVPVVVLSALPVIQLAQIAHDSVLRWGPPVVPLIEYVEAVVVAWLVAMLARAVGVALAPSPTPSRRWLRAIAGGLVLAAPLWLAPLLIPTGPWWRQPALHGGVDPNYPNPASEQVLAAQVQLLDEALSGLADERPGVTDLYVVSFGGYASEDVFRKDLELAQRVMDDRWDTHDRSVTLLNNPRTLLQTPIATVSNLRETLNEIGAAIDADEDVVMVYLASHGSPESLSVELPPLELVQLTPGVLRSLLDEAGITWRIIVVSACYSGSFIPALQDDHTMVITASQADRTSFGCGFRSDGTYFGQAFFGEGLAKAESFPAAIELARQEIAAREAAEGASPPSNPQMVVGAAMQAKLKELERGSAARRAGKLVCATCGRAHPHSLSARRVSRTTPDGILTPAFAATERVRPRSHEQRVDSN
ncbi:MAG: C13 family peptidase [Casimicrobiaceae bacterium]